MTDKTSKKDRELVGEFEVSAMLLGMCPIGNTDPKLQARVQSARTALLARLASKGESACDKTSEE